MRVAAVQMTSTQEVEANLALSESLVREAASAGASLVALPENFSYFKVEGEVAAFQTSLDGELVARFGSLARELAVTLLLGSIPEAIPDSEKTYNTSVLLGPDGQTLAFYRKIHLFDVDVPGVVELKESKAVEAGDEVVTAKTPACVVGLTVCYDLRFPELYRRLARAGAEVLTVPSAFLPHTGKDHWEALLRARAIENQAYVIAPAQFGRHSERRASYGRSLIIDPWGLVLAQAPDGEGVITAEIDLDHLRTLRRNMPCLEHMRLL
ncbi:MAG: carbon-nitrogen hydrolase family protein [bacterium]|nr:carbon-nitrogen hydrolase family protein [bacterium]